MSVPYAFLAAAYMMMASVKCICCLFLKLIPSTPLNGSLRNF